MATLRFFSNPVNSNQLIRINPVNSLVRPRPILYCKFLKFLLSFVSQKRLGYKNVCPETLGAMLEYWYIERGLLTIAWRPKIKDVATLLVFKVLADGRTDGHTNNHVTTKSMGPRSRAFGAQELRYKDARSDSAFVRLLEMKLLVVACIFGEFCKNNFKWKKLRTVITPTPICPNKSGSTATVFSFSHPKWNLPDHLFPL